MIKYTAEQANAKAEEVSKFNNTVALSCSDIQDQIQERAAEGQYWVDYKTDYKTALKMTEELQKAGYSVKFDFQIETGRAEPEDEQEVEIEVSW